MVELMQWVGFGLSFDNKEPHQPSMRHHILCLTFSTLFIGVEIKILFFSLPHGSWFGFWNLIDFVLKVVMLYRPYKTLL